MNGILKKWVAIEFKSGLDVLVDIDSGLPNTALGKRQCMYVCPYPKVIDGNDDLRYNVHTNKYGDERLSRNLAQAIRRLVLRLTMDSH